MTLEYWEIRGGLLSLDPIVLTTGRRHPVGRERAFLVFHSSFLCATTTILERRKTQSPRCRQKRDFNVVEEKGDDV